MQRIRQNAWEAVIAVVMITANARAQDIEISCNQYSCDYSNMVSPKSGGATVKEPMHHYPGSSTQNNLHHSQMPQARGNNEWRQMVPNQDAYRTAYNRRMSSRR